MSKVIERTIDIFILPNTTQHTIDVHNVDPNNIGVIVDQFIKGDKGDKGIAGSSASVTSVNIINALGYTPADVDDIPTVPEISTNIVDDITSDTKTVSPKAVNTFIESKGYTTNEGTITSVKMNGATIASSGEVDLGQIITEHQSLDNYIQKSQTAGLIKNDGTVDTTPYGTYIKPSNGIPASDLASGVIPVVPIISTNITTDGSSDTKTVSPKAVKTYVDSHSANVEAITMVELNVLWGS